jgi:hypothetical protein
MSFADIDARISASAINMLADADVSWQPFGESTVYTCRGLFNQPGTAVLDGEVITTDYSVGYLSGALPGLKRDEVLAINGADWKVREIMPNGNTSLAMLKAA